MQVTVRFFASLRETTGITQCALDLPEQATLEQAISHLVSMYPALQGHQGSWHFAVNQVQAGLEVRLRPGDTIAVFPYIAGG